ncbi:MAG: hypothetical protein HC764_00435 [Pleurocapsa sp. CRU_1_2]|nr:hypothetical protein [Pleurocapsa sp. CRU_1_2]
MKQNIRLFSTPNSLWSKLLDSNPQLFREIQGKLKTRNMVIAARSRQLLSLLQLFFC